MMRTGIKNQYFFFFLLFGITVQFSFAQKTSIVSAHDFKKLVGCWEGTLQYSGTLIRKPFSTKAKLVVTQLRNPDRFQFLHIYTSDPAENVADTVNLANNGKKINGENVHSKRLSRDSLEVVTEVVRFDHDYNKAAIERKIYRIGRKSYQYKKQVQLKGQQEWLDREEFNYSSIPCGTEQLQ